MGISTALLLLVGWMFHRIDETLAIAMDDSQSKFVFCHIESYHNYYIQNQKSHWKISCMDLVELIKEINDKYQFKLYLNKIL